MYLWCGERRRSDVDDDGIIMERVQPGDFPAATARQQAAGAGVRYWDRDMDLITWPSQYDRQGMKVLLFAIWQGMEVIFLPVGQSMKVFVLTVTKYWDGRVRNGNTLVTALWLTATPTSPPETRDPGDIIHNKSVFPAKIQTKKSLHQTFKTLTAKYDSKINIVSKKYSSTRKIVFIAKILFDREYFLDSNYKYYVINIC